MDEPSLKQRIEDLEREVARLAAEVRNPVSLATPEQWFGLWHADDHQFIAASVVYEDLVDICDGVGDSDHLQIVPVKVTITAPEEEQGP